MIGKTLGSYRIVGRIGEGGMGMVYAAEHPLIHRRAAIKVLLPSFSDNKEVVERFFNEARAATMIKHAGIVDIFDFGYADDGSAYIVMEYLDGETLSDRIDRVQVIDEMDVYRFSRQSASALAAAHQAGIIHRDLKPDNIFVVIDYEIAGGERIKLLDFGIAKLSGDAASGMRKTRTGAVMGSPLYMSPEQCRGAGDADERADIYSLGCVMYHMATGGPPFDGQGAGEVIGKHIYEEAIPPRQRAGRLGETLDAIIMQCLNKRPDHRFASMRALIKAIDSATDGVFATRPNTLGHATPPEGVPVVPPTGRIAARRAMPGKSTTLASAASQLTMDEPPRRGRGRLLAGLAVAFVAGLGLTIWLASRGGGEKAAAASIGEDAGNSGNATTAGRSGTNPHTAARSDRAAAPDTESAIDHPAAKAVDGATAEKVTLRIDSKPSPALVRSADRALLGETPFAIQVDQADDPIVFFVTQVGYADAEVKLVPDQDREHRVKLARADRPSAKRPKRDVLPRDPKAKKKKGGFGETIDPLAGP